MISPLIRNRIHDTNVQVWYVSYNLIFSYLTVQLSALTSSKLAVKHSLWSFSIMYIFIVIERLYCIQKVCFLVFI